MAYIEDSEPKWVNCIWDVIGLNSFWHVGLHITFNFCKIKISSLNYLMAFSSKIKNWKDFEKYYHVKNRYFINLNFELSNIT